MASKKKPVKKAIIPVKKQQAKPTAKPAAPKNKPSKVQPARPAPIPVKKAPAKAVPVSKPKPRKNKRPAYKDLLRHHGRFVSKDLSAKIKELRKIYRAQGRFVTNDYLLDKFMQASALACAGENSFDMMNDDRDPFLQEIIDVAEQGVNISEPLLNGCKDTLLSFYKSQRDLGHQVKIYITFLGYDKRTNIQVMYTSVGSALEVMDEELSDIHHGIEEIYLKKYTDSPLFAIPVCLNDYTHTAFIDFSGINITALYPKELLNDILSYKYENR